MSLTTTPPITIIVAATSSTLGIGSSGQLPWRLKSELAYFARVTKRAPNHSKNAVIMGRKTYNSIPQRFRPLADRINVVVSRSPETLNIDEGVLTASSIDDALKALKESVHDANKVFVIGGGELYAAAMEHQNTRNLLCTRVEGAFKCDIFFPLDFRKPEHGWHRATHDKLCEFAGEDVPVGLQNEMDIKYEYELWQK